MYLVTPSTVLNRSALETRHVPCRFLGRSLLIPVRGVGFGLILRLIFEVEMLRYLAALLPVAFAAIIWPDKSIAIAQGPLLMFMVVYAVEMSFVAQIGRDSSRESSMLAGLHEQTHPPHLQD